MNSEKYKRSLSIPALRDLTTTTMASGSLRVLPWVTSFPKFLPVKNPRLIKRISCLFQPRPLTHLPFLKAFTTKSWQLQILLLFLSDMYVSALCFSRTWKPSLAIWSPWRRGTVSTSLWQDRIPNSSNHQPAWSHLHWSTLCNFSLESLLTPPPYWRKRVLTISCLAWLIFDRVLDWEKTFVHIYLTKRFISWSIKNCKTLASWKTINTCLCMWCVCIYVYACSQKTCNEVLNIVNSLGKCKIRSKWGKISHSIHWLEYKKFDYVKFWQGCVFPVAV